MVAVCYDHRPSVQTYKAMGQKKPAKVWSVGAVLMVLQDNAEEAGG